MTNARQTKRALLSSITALFLCFSMLLGTTFAWFTDTVTSANNIIVSGNLDVELYYQAEGQTGWTQVTESTNVFKANTLWEPGHTEIVRLKVVNEGSLALKYNLGVNVASEVGSVNVNNEAFKLSDVIKFGIVDGAQTYTRDQAIAAAEANDATALKTAYNSGTTELDAKNDGDTDEKIVTMVVYMPTTVGNEANAKNGAAVPTIHLGINLFATQRTYEKDSFDNQYDAAAPIVIPPVERPASGNGMILEGTKENDVKIALPAAVVDALPAGVEAISLAMTEPVVDVNAKTVTFDAIEIVDQNGKVIDLDALNAGEKIEVTLALPEAVVADLKGKTVMIYHDGVCVATDIVDDNGVISYDAEHFCEVTIALLQEPVVNGDTIEIGTAAQLFSFAQSVNNGESYAGKTVVLTADIDLNNAPWTPIGDANADVFVGFNGTFDGQGHTISNLYINSASWGQGLFGYMDKKTNATIQNVNVYNADITATDCCGVIVGYATNGTFSNISVAGDVSVVGTVADGHVGGIAGCGYNANFEKCSVTGATIISAGSFAGGIVGYQCNNTKTITECSVKDVTITGYSAVGGVAGIIQTGTTFSDCSVENVNLYMTRVDGDPAIGALFGTYSGSAKTDLASNTVKNVTLNGAHTAYEAHGVLFGSNYGGGIVYEFIITDAAVKGVTNKLEEVTKISDGLVKKQDGTYLVHNANGLKTGLTTAAAAGAGDNTIVLTCDIDLTGTAWTPIKVDGYHGADIVTIEGNGATIKGLNAPLFAGGFAGGSGIVIKDLTIAASDIVSTNTLGSGAFIESIDSMSTITLINCHLVNSTVTGGNGSRTGGLIGWTAGYNNVNDGPVKTYVTIKDCSVIGNTITCNGSVGAINGHAGNNAWTYTTIENCTVKDNKLISTDDGDWRVGVVVGTANVGEVAISNITESGNTLTQTGKTAPTGQSNLYGRFVPGATGKLVINGVEYVGSAVALAEALKKSQDVLLINDIQVTDVVTLAEISGVDVTLNLNGHKIDATLNGSEGWSQIFRVSKGATFTVVGEGAVHATAYPTLTYGSVIFNNVGGNLIIEGGKYTMTYGSYGDGYLLPAIVDTNSNTEKATTTINGGEFYHNRNMFRNFAQPQRGENNATLIINGGTFTGEADDYATIWNQKTNANGVEGDGIVTITGGNFQYMDVCNDFETGVTIADGLNIAVQAD